MKLNEIKNKINSNEYDFLRNNEHLGNNIILLTCGGSYAYGTNNDESDLDIRGIAIERPSEILGLSNFEQFLNTETDTTIYALRKVFNLFLNCNPNTIEMLGTKDDQLFICNKYGRLLRNNVDIFLSKKAIGSFGGYANQQLRRLKNALIHDEYMNEEKETNIMNNLKHQMLSMEARYKKLNDSEFNMYIDKSKKVDMENEIFVDINMKHYPVRDLKNFTNEIQNTIKDFDKLNHRNNKKDEKHLLKHAMHLIRLLLMGIEILKGEGVNTYREKDKNLLLDIRNGKYTYDEIFEMNEKLEKEFKYVADNSSLPSKPNYKKAEELLMSIYKDVLKNEN